MLTSFYFFIIPLILVCAFSLYKFLIYREKLVDFENQSSAEKNNLEIAVEEVFVFLDNTQQNLKKDAKITLHWLLHLFVIFLGFISDLTDVLYAKTRDFFLHTATKEKHTVSKFWHTLVEYKREKEEERGE